uniref:Uncharacterized protein n=1 Tax=Salvator merianae TaxID=96440 RepID=A0A8D0BJQ0_SALMN
MYTRGLCAVLCSLSRSCASLSLKQLWPPSLSPGVCAPRKVRHGCLRASGPPY